MIGLDGQGQEEMHPSAILCTGLVYMTFPGLAMVFVHCLYAIYLSFGIDNVELNNNKLNDNSAKKLEKIIPG